MNICLEVNNLCIQHDIEGNVFTNHNTIGILIKYGRKKKLWQPYGTLRTGVPTVGAKLSSKRQYN